MEMSTVHNQVTPQEVSPTVVEEIFNTLRQQIIYRFLGHAEILGVLIYLDLKTYENCPEAYYIGITVTFSPPLDAKKWFNFIIPQGSLFKLYNIKHLYKDFQKGFNKKFIDFPNLQKSELENSWYFFARILRSEVCSNNIKEYLNIQKTHQLVEGIPIIDDELKYVWENPKYATKHGSENI